jgi:hypothetical protein
VNKTPTGDRMFVVRARHVDRHHGRRLAEASFEAAAIAYAEDHPPSPESGSEISIIVRDAESGREQCFRIDLDTGEAAPCD